MALTDIVALIQTEFAAGKIITPRDVRDVLITIVAAYANDDPTLLGLINTMVPDNNTQEIDPDELRDVLIAISGYMSENDGIESGKITTKLFRIGTPDPVITDWVDEVVTFGDPKTIDELIATLPGLNRQNCIVSSSTVQPLPRRVSVYTEQRNNEYISITYIGVSAPPEPTTGFDYIVPFILS